MRIPLPKMMRHWREREFAGGLAPARARWALKLWALAARWPSIYHRGARLALWWLNRRRAGGKLASVPYGEGWTRHRDFPAPQGRSFQSQWTGARSAYRARRAAAP